MVTISYNSVISVLKSSCLIIAIFEGITGTAFYSAVVNRTVVAEIVLSWRRRG